MKTRPDFKEYYQKLYPSSSMNSLIPFPITVL